MVILGCAAFVVPGCRSGVHVLECGTDHERVRCFDCVKVSQNVLERLSFRRSQLSMSLREKSQRKKLAPSPPSIFFTGGGCARISREAVSRDVWLEHLDLSSIPTSQEKPRSPEFAKYEIKSSLGIVLNLFPSP